MFLKQILAREAKLRGLNMLHVVFPTANYQVATIRPIVSKLKHCIVLIIHHYMYIFFLYKEVNIDQIYAGINLFIT